MDYDTKDKFYGITIREWLRDFPNELEDDAIGLWQIIPLGKRGYGLSGSELKEFIEEAIEKLIDLGAVPVVGVESEGGWKLCEEYGDKKEEIIKNIVEKWGAPDSPDPDVGDLWFATPTFLEAMKPT